MQIGDGPQAHTQTVEYSQKQHGKIKIARSEERRHIGFHDQRYPKQDHNSACFLNNSANNCLCYSPTRCVVSVVYQLITQKVMESRHVERMQSQPNYYNDLFEVLGGSLVLGLLSWKQSRKLCRQVPGVLIVADEMMNSCRQVIYDGSEPS